MQVESDKNKIRFASESPKKSNNQKKEEDISGKEKEEIGERRR